MRSGERIRYGRDSPSNNPPNGGSETAAREKTVPVPAEDLHIMLAFFQQMDQAAQVNRRIIARLRELLEDENP